tara:strand:- start:228 stop:1292 length:1065 start_codon:yes stop_codon:yes gene_type:complete
MGKYKLKDMNEVIQSFDDSTQKKLKAKSADSLKQMLGDKSFRQASMDSMKLLQDVMELEGPYRDQLTELAKDIVYKMFPVIEQAGIDIDAEIVDSPQNMKITKQQGEEKIEDKEEAEVALDAVADKSNVDKRRIINSITQGAGIRGTKAYYLFDNAMDILETLGVKDKYEELVNNAYGVYDSDEAIAMMMAMLSQGGGSQGGESEVDWNEEEDTMTIKAKALTFPILMQEIIKGLYEFVSLQGFTDIAKDKGASITKAVDKVTNEPEDIRYGKFIYDGLRDLVDDYAENPNEVRELFFAEVYKLDSSWFKIFIENVINDQLTSDQKSWVERTIKDLENTDEETDEDGDQPIGIS